MKSKTLDLHVINMSFDGHIVSTNASLAAR